MDSQSIHEHLESVRHVIVTAALMPSFVSAGYRRFLEDTQALRVLPYLSSSKAICGKPVRNYMLRFAFFYLLCFPFHPTLTSCVHIRFIFGVIIEHPRARTEIGIQPRDGECASGSLELLSVADPSVDGSGFRS